MTTCSRLSTLLVVVLLAGCGSSSAGRRGDGLALADTGSPGKGPVPRFVLAEDEFDREIVPPAGGARWGVTDSTVQPARVEPDGQPEDQDPAVEQPSSTTPRAGQAAKPKPRAVRSTAPAPVYACPMHPEVTDTKPSKCPKCGMTLVRKTPR
jgi:heavy metal-binding protein